jgi:hypothetical protein
MFKLIALFSVSVCFFFSSCLAVKKIPIKGQYQNGPYMDTTTWSKDQVWDKVVDFFAQNGLSIKIIDKSSGLITSDHTKLIASFEDKKGLLMKKDAWIVLPKEINPRTTKPYPIEEVYGEWNIRIKEVPQKGTIINVNLVNITTTRYTAVGTGFSSTSIPKQVPVYDYKLTGNFEKRIIDLIKS